MGNEYFAFIDSIRQSRPLNVFFTGCEQHHIVPKCNGGTDESENLIYLTYAEHFTAHKLLTKCFPNDKKLAYALWRMANGKHECSPEDYAFARERFMDAGLSIETRRKMSQAHLGKQSPRLGVKPTEETRLKMREAAKRRTASGALGKTWSISDDAKHKHRLLYRRNIYHIICRQCSKEFISDMPCYRYCDSCRASRRKAK